MAPSERSLAMGDFQDMEQFLSVAQRAARQAPSAGAMPPRTSDGFIKHPKAVCGPNSGTCGAVVESRWTPREWALFCSILLDRLRMAEKLLRAGAAREEVLGALGCELASDDPLLRTVDEVERRHILAVLESVGGRKQVAARVLGINRNTLWSKLREYGYESNDGEAACG